LARTSADADAAGTCGTDVIMAVAAFDRMKGTFTGQRMLQMVQLGNLAKPRTDRAELFAKSSRRKRQNGLS
jgi:hypothetical protein